MCACDKNVRPVSEQQQLRASCPGGFELPDELGLDSYPSGSLACGSGCMWVQAVAELGSTVRSWLMAKPLWHRGHPLLPAALSQAGDSLELVCVSLPSLALAAAALGAPVVPCLASG